MRTLILVMASLAAIAASAQETSDTAVETLDVTMKLMPEGASLPQAVTRVIELPPAAAAAAAAQQNAAGGLDAANAAGDNRQDGLARATEVSERGLERAEEVREAFGRGGFGSEPPGPPDSPGDAPGPGGPPNTPGPPGN